MSCKRERRLVTGGWCPGTSRENATVCFGRFFRGAAGRQREGGQSGENMGEEATGSVLRVRATVGPRDWRVEK